MNPPFWFEVTVVCGFTAIGAILLGHSETGMPEWRRVLKVFVASGLALSIPAAAGGAGFFASLGAALAGALIVQVGCGEPRERRLHRWNLPSNPSA